LCVTYEAPPATRIDKLMSRIDALEQKFQVLFGTLPNATIGFMIINVNIA